MNWNDDTEFEARLRQFQPRRPPELPMVPAPRRPARTWMLTCGVVLGCLTAFAVFRGASFVTRPSGTAGTSVEPSPDPPSRLFPQVEMTLYASAPPPLVGPDARVDVSFPAGPSRRAVSRVQPEYPPEAQRLGLEAGLDLRITVDPEGLVTTTERLGGGTSVYRDDPNARERAEFVATNAQVFWNAAEAAARRWTFEPAQTSMTCVISFAFRLSSASNASAGRAADRQRPATPSGSSQPGFQPTRGPVRVGGDVRAPVALVKVNPVYPPEAQAAQLQGVVLLEIRIATDGSVSEARVLRSIPMLDQAAIDAVKQWKYQPTRVDGVPVEVEMNVYINFTLSQ
jgi:TonB family protein